MQKKSSVLFILLIVIASPVTGQHLKELSDVELKQFKQNSFNIDLLGLQLVNATGNDATLGHSRHWAAYQGYDQVAESDFFARAGYDELAKKAQRSRRNKFIAIGLGGLGVVAGSFMIASGKDAHDPGRMKSSVRPYVLGGLMITAGSGTIGFSVMGMQRRSVSYRIAHDVATEYNNKLLREIH